ncbi:MAG: hypothetical protein U5K51_12630 [Flavobacteriaceae bacterium]|nr:hypothetical protein [Flavobacteriaceae bacterium]
MATVSDTVYQVTRNDLMCARYPAHSGKYESKDNYITISSRIDDSNFISEDLKVKNGFSDKIKGHVAHIMAMDSNWMAELLRLLIM